jgi:hypothetical protein
VTLLLRLIGVPVLQSFIARLPRGVARLLGAVLVVASNLAPFGALLAGSMTLGDVVLVYWIETVVVFGWSVVRARTSRAGTADARRLATLFSSVFFGVWAVVMGVWAVIIAVRIGLTGGVGSYLLVVGAIVVSASYAMAYQWFFRGQRTVVTPLLAIAPVIPRSIPLMAGTLVGAFTSIGPWASPEAQVTAGLWLVGLRTVVDVLVQWIFDRVGERRLARGPAPSDGRASARPQEPRPQRY